MIFSKIDRSESILYLIRPLIELYNLEDNFEDKNSLGVLYKILLAYEIYHYLAYMGKPKMTIIYKRIFVEDLDLKDDKEFNYVVYLIKKLK